ncbi:MAG: helix-turn-helix domain-containing protein [Planctomycetaceae bacterium]|nr:helix-turn-helix domain-containing protein [Planctomycetaceae bacterium]
MIQRNNCAQALDSSEETTSNITTDIPVAPARIAPDGIQDLEGYLPVQRSANTQEANPRRHSGLFTAQQAAIYLCLDMVTDDGAAAVRTLRHYVDTRELRPTRIGKFNFFHREDLDDFVNRRRKPERGQSASTTTTNSERKPAGNRQLVLRQGS